MEAWDRKSGKSSGGLRTLEHASTRYCVNKYGGKAVSELCLVPEAGRVFALDQHSRQRRQNRTCRDLHPGLCRFDVKAIYRAALRLAGNIFKNLPSSTSISGETLLKIAPSGPRSSEAHFLWLMRRTKKPKRLYFTEAVLIAADDRRFVEITRPLVRSSNFGLARKLMNENHDGADWTLTVLRHRTDQGPLWRTLLIGEDPPLPLSCKQKQKAEVDLLDVAMAQACAPAGKPKRRLRKKVNIDAARESSGSEAEDDLDDESSSSSDAAVVEDKKLDVKVQPPKNSYFHKELGLKGVDNTSKQNKTNKSD